MRCKAIGGGRLLFAALEFLPLSVFAYAGRMGTDLADRFIWGAGTAVVVVPILLLAGRRLNPILVAVNGWLCVEAFAFLVPVALLTAVLAALAESAYFLSIALVGTVYTLVSPRGMLTVEHGNRRRVRLLSAGLLALTVCAFAWSIFFRGDEMVAAVYPAMGLFLAQAVFGARLNVAGRST